MKNDDEYVRGLNLELIEQGREAINEMLEVAKQTEHPRSYEVLSKLIKDVADIGDKFLENEKRRKEIEHVGARKGLPAAGETGSIIAMTTEEALRLMKQEEEKDVTPPIEHGQE